MNVLQHTRNELNLFLMQNRPDRSYRDTLLTTSFFFLKFNYIERGKRMQTMWKLAEK